MTTVINLWAVLAAAIAAFVLGGIWYSPKAFGNIWKQETGKTTQGDKKSHGTLKYILLFVFTFIAAFTFALFLGPMPELGLALYASVITGICWIATSFAINYMFAGRGLKLFFIDGGYHIFQFVLYGLILGLWH